MSAPVRLDKGWCPVCRKAAVFKAYTDDLRASYRCNCKRLTGPRHRALALTLENLYPDWRRLRLHESSPAGNYLAEQSENYSCSFFRENVKPGTEINGLRCENLEHLLFSDNSFDIFITQDVLEHVFRPDLALRESIRVIKPGGAHLFTTPRLVGRPKSVCRAENEADGVRFLCEPSYHTDGEGNDVLVTWDWGVDFEELIRQWCGVRPATYLIRDPYFGLDGMGSEVFVVRKP